MRSHLALLLATLTALLLAPGQTAAQEIDRHDHDRRLGNSESGGIADLSDRLVDVSAAGSTVIGKAPVAVFRSATVDEPFTGAVIRFRLPNRESAPRVWMKLGITAGQDAWLEAVLLGDGSSGVILAAVHSQHVVDSGRFEVAIDIPDAIILDAAVFNNLDDDDAKSQDWDVGRSAKGAASGLIVPPHLITRADWAASPFRGQPVPLAQPSYDRITFHHAACCGAYTYEEGIAEVKGIQVFHQDGRGWSDIGYHFLLDQSGRLYQGRPFMNEGATLDDTPVLAQGAHVGGFNTGNIGVSVLGCYHPPEGGGCRDVLSPAAYDSLVAVIAFLSERYGVPPSAIAGHRDFSSTACPGDNNYVLLPQIRNDVAELLRTGNAAVGAASLAALADDYGVVRLDWQFTRDDGIVEYVVERRSAVGTDTVYESQIVEDLAFVDAEVDVAGSVTYVLSARNADGRWQTLSVAEVEVVSPDGFELAQSFPNPTDSRATIRYFLAEEGLVDLALFDAAGRRVSRLVNDFQSAGRWYSVAVDLTSLPAGQYYYRIQVEGFTAISFEDVRAIAVAR